MAMQRFDTDQKALDINLDDKIYGTFAEIGAGQEVARYFFKVGAAAGTIAKSMSAYDKTYSDAIYGTEFSGRYVCESRLHKMLDHEYSLLEERLNKSRPNTRFFAFADTVASMNFSRTIKGHGWLGLRFQLTPQGHANNLVLHVRMLDNTPQLQQSAIGVLGVNLVHACFHYHHDIDAMITALHDGLQGRAVIDMVRLWGPDFKDFDNRLVGLKIVQHGLTDVAMIDPSGNTVHGSEFLYKKSMMVVRGTYRPPTKVSENVFKAGFNQFSENELVDPERAHLAAEITLDNLKRTGDIDEEDFLARAKALNAMGHTLLVSNCQHHQQLINYLSDFKIQQLGLVIGVRELLDIIKNKYIKNQDGRLLVAFGELFNRNITVYAYPAIDPDTNELWTTKNLPVPEGISFLYQHLLKGGQIVDIENADIENLNIFGWEVHKMIQDEKPGWQSLVPEPVKNLIVREGLFKGPTVTTKFEY